MCFLFFVSLFWLCIIMHSDIVINNVTNKFLALEIFFQYPEN